MAILDTAATASLVRFRWLTHRNSILEKVGIPRLSTYLALARFKFGGGGIGDARFVADIAMGAAGAKGIFTASVLDADILALSR